MNVVIKKAANVTESPIVAVYVGLITQPRRFVLHRKVSSERANFELFKPRTLREFVSQLLIALAPMRADFMAEISRLDDEQFQQSKLKTRRYVAEHRDVLYINSAHLVDNSEQILDYWVATNIGRKEVSTIVGFACAAAGVKRESISKLQL